MNTKHLLFSLLLVVSGILLGQGNVQYPSSLSYNTPNYIKASTPTDTSMTEGIWLPQGIVKRLSVNQEVPVFIPSNKPTWPIAIAVAWNMERNLIQRVGFPQISSFLATAAFETELRCESGLTWSSAEETPAAYSDETSAPAMNNGGCFQLEGPSSAYGVLTRAYPNRFSAEDHELLIEGVNSFETSVLAFVYYHIHGVETFDKYLNWDFMKSIDCTTDSLAFVKSTASLYNGGDNAFQSAKSYFDGSAVANSCWNNFPATTANYANDLASYVASLEGMTNHCDHQTAVKQQRYYDEEITWKSVSKYLNLLRNLYPELDFKTVVNPSVKAAFDKISVEAAVKFSKMGPVIDAILFNLPKEYSIPVEGTPVGVSVNDLYSKSIPYAEIVADENKASLCLGEALRLEIKSPIALDSSVTYQWFNWSDTSKILSTQKAYVYQADSVGKYAVGAKICNANGCYSILAEGSSTCTESRNKVGYSLTVTDCSSACDFSVVSVNTDSATCSGENFTGATTITLSKAAKVSVESVLSNDARIDTLGKLSFDESTSIKVDSLEGGLYNFTITDDNNSACVLKTNATVKGKVQWDELTAKTIMVNDCKADIKATVQSMKTQSSVKVRVWSPTYFQWEKSMLFQLESTGGQEYEGGYNKMSPRGGISEWNETPMIESWFDMEYGDSLSIKSALIPTPGAGQNYDYTVQVMDNKGVQLAIFDVPVAATKLDSSYSIGTYVHNVVNSENSYVFSWSPEVRDLVETNNTTKGTTLTLLQYRNPHDITATPADNKACTLKSSLKVIANDFCIIAGTEDVGGTISVNPNPTSGWLNISGVSGSTLVIVYSTSGSLVQQVTLNGTTGSIDLSSFNKGFYTVSIISQEKTVVAKVLKK